MARGGASRGSGAKTHYFHRWYPGICPERRIQEPDPSRGRRRRSSEDLVPGVDPSGIARVRSYVFSADRLLITSGFRLVAVIVSRLDRAVTLQRAPMV